jgi:phage-related protein (TIGR01555 family)
MVELMKYFDSLVNVLSGIGSSKDRTTQTQVAEVQELTDIELEVLYRRNHYAARIIDYLPNESTRRGFKVSVTDSEDGGHEFEECFRKLGVTKAFNKADKWSRLYGGAAVIIGVDDGKDPSEPLLMDEIVSGKAKIKELEFVHVLDRYSMTPGRLDSDPKSPGFGYPECYTLNRRDQVSFGAKENSYGPGTVVHASRMIRFYGVELPPNLLSEQDWWGDGVLQRAYDGVANLGMMERAIGNISQTFVQAVFKMKGLRELVKDKDGEGNLISRFTAMNLSQSVLSMMVIDADGEDFERRTTNVAGLDKLYDRIAQSYAVAADMPLTLALGQSPGGMSSDDASGTRNWENKVRANQEQRYLPGLEKIAHILAASAQGPSASGDIKVEANPLREPTEEEQAKTAKTWGEFAAIMIDRGVLRPLEVRTSFFSGASFSSTIMLDDEAPDDLEAEAEAEAIEMKKAAEQKLKH